MFLNEDAQNTYEDEKENGSREDIEFELEDDYAQLKDDEYSWTWTIHSVVF